MNVIPVNVIIVVHIWTIFKKLFGFIKNGIVLDTIIPKHIITSAIKA